MNTLYVKYSLQSPLQFHLCDSQGLRFSVTTATGLHLKEAPLLRGSGSSSKSLRKICFLAFWIARKCNMNIGKLFFESDFSALQTLHFHFQISKNQYSKGFHLVTLTTKTPEFVTKRNRIRNTALQLCYKSLVTTLVAGLSGFVTFVTEKIC